MHPRDRSAAYTLGRVHAIRGLSNAAFRRARQLEYSGSRAGACAMRAFAEELRLLERLRLEELARALTERE